jgi:lipoprotein-anchoring transpeptidase ErfK/SrfK
MQMRSRREVLAGAAAAGAALGLGGCVTSGLDRSSLEYGGPYGALNDGAFIIPAVDQSHIHPAFLRQEVVFDSRYKPGTVVVDPSNHYLYYVQGGGRAMRYGVGVGGEGFAWAGVATVHDKQKWPNWYPPKEMIQRQPELRQFLTELPSGQGMRGGLINPLGARALYLWDGNRDTLYRIHGTNEPWSVGTNASSGCIRMINQDVVDLYERVRVGSNVTVLAPGTG